MPSDPSDAVNFQTDAERFHLLVDAITDYAIYMLDRDGRIITWNAGAARLKGYTAASASRDTRRKKSSVSTFGGSLPGRISRAICRRRSSR